MKTLAATILLAGMSMTPLSSAQAFTVSAAPLAEAAQDISSIAEVAGCGRGTTMGPRGCQAITYGAKKSKKKPAKK